MFKLYKMHLKQEQAKFLKKKTCPNKRYTFKSPNKCESISQSEKQQLEELIKLEVVLYDNKPSVWPLISDLLAQAMGEGSSIGPREFIKFRISTC